jgi:hypothetical protein
VPNFEVIAWWHQRVGILCRDFSIAVSHRQPEATYAKTHKSKSWGADVAVQVHAAAKRFADQR